MSHFGLIHFTINSSNRWNGSKSKREKWKKETTKK